MIVMLMKRYSNKSKSLDCLFEKRFINVVIMTALFAA